jgi:hypothetical protein
VAGGTLEKRNLFRRKFIREGLTGSVSLWAFPGLPGLRTSRQPEKALDYQVTRMVPTRLFDGTKCWAHPRAGIIPGGGTGDLSRVVMTMNSLDLSGSDVFKGMFGFSTDDLGRHWTEVREIPNLAPRFETLNGEVRPVAVSDFWPKYHHTSRTLLGTGHTVVYTPDWKVTSPRPRHTAFSIYDPREDSWSAWQKLALPELDKFYNSGAGCAQRYDDINGMILLPVSFYPPTKNAHITVLQCSFDGKQLSYIQQGNELGIDEASRGLHEPSIARFNDRYFMTIRNDHRAYVTYSDDGLNYHPIQPWKFDDGSELGSYNTQQHWVTHSEGLFLVYTRRGAGNDHVFRHRAPLFIARIDTEKLRVIRDTERILVPERGARLGNFGVTDISSDETWVTVSEWMQPAGVEKYGSDGRVWIARIQWNKPNRLFII